MPAQPLNVEVRWSEIKELHDTQWREGYCLYAYKNPITPDIHYVGHTNYSTIRMRKYGRHKKIVYEKILSKANVNKKQLIVMRGDVWLEDDKRLSHKLLKQVESLRQPMEDGRVPFKKSWSGIFEKSWYALAT